ncbi:hypothetical protein EPO04_02485 [Patescibacteria group bacterium]|nr:MAG: hypothetical protein EPO04_02485 [Patescibacteria group bacterium]
MAVFTLTPQEFSSGKMDSRLWAESLKSNRLYQLWLDPTLVKVKLGGIDRTLSLLLGFTGPVEAWFILDSIDDRPSQPATKLRFKGVIAGHEVEFELMLGDHNVLLTPGGQMEVGYPVGARWPTWFSRRWRRRRECRRA